MKRMKHLSVLCLLLVVAVGCGTSAAARRSGSLVVTVTAGPTCPAEKVGDPACAPRPVKGARLRLEGPGETTLVTDASGTARDQQIPVGAYGVIPQPVPGLMGTPARLDIVIRQRRTTHVVVSYDTGIR
jgi:hypothetical protein